MTERSIAHGTFRSERTYPVPPARVWAAFADKAQKAKWYGDPTHNRDADLFEFREGGRERKSSELDGGGTWVIEWLYHDIVANQRIVYTYDVVLKGRRNSVSLVTVEFTPVGHGTTVKIREDGAFLDGLEVPNERQGGAAFVLDRLGQLLSGSQL